jgi:AraC-like DNA-binding protein
MSAANNFVSDLYAIAHEQQLDATALLRDAGISEEVIGDADIRVERKALAKFQINIWDALDDEAMGLSDYPIRRGTFHMLGKLAVGERTLRDALVVGADFQRVASDAYTVTLTERGDTAELLFTMSSASHPKYYLLAEITLLAWHRMASWLIAENVTLKRIYFDYEKPSHFREYEYLLPADYEFDKGRLGFTFSSTLLERKVCQTRETLESFIAECPEDLYARPRQDFSLASAVRRVLRGSMVEGFASIEVVASELHLSRRSLTRKLESEGTSFQQIKDFLRRDRAVFLLESRTRSVSEVAESIGFSDAAVFARAFKTWTGMSPTQFRSQLSPP